MKDFKSYSNDLPNEKPQNGNSTDFNNSVEIANIIAKAMNGKSETQILHTIIAEAERSKREGKLSNDDLDNFYNMLYPTLDGFKRKKLKEIIARLKNI